MKYKLTYFNYCFITTIFLVIMSFIGKSQNAGDNIFNSSKIHIIKISFEQVNFWDSLNLNYKTERKLLGKVEIDGTAIDSVAFRLKGNSSYMGYYGYKKSIKIDFDEYARRTFDGLRSFNLNNGFKDPTMMREKIYLDFCKKHGIIAPRCTYAKVYINDKYWGLYTLVEQIDKTFLMRVFGNSKGNLFKGDQNGSLGWLGFEQENYYYQYELKNNKKKNDWSDLISLTSRINYTPYSSFIDTIQKLINIDYLISSWAGNIIFVNLDSYQGSGHNYYIYHDDSTKKFNWITWDVNEAFGNFQLGMNIYQLQNLGIFYIPQVPYNARALGYSLLASNYFKNLLLQKISSMLAHDFSNHEMDNYIDSLKNRIKADYYSDPNKIYTNKQFDENIEKDISSYGIIIPGLKSFISERRKSLKYQLAPYGIMVTEETIDSNSFVACPETFHTETLIYIPKSLLFKNIELSLHSKNGKNISDKIIIRFSRFGNRIHIFRKELKNGNYVLKIKHEKKTIQKIKLCLV